MPGTFQKQIAALAQNEEERLLLSRTEDLLSRAAQGTVTCSDFLNPGEQYLIRRFLVSTGLQENRDFLFWGGCPHAERKLLFLLPEYLYDVYRMDPDCDIAAALCSACKETDAIGAVSVTGSGYKTLSHRDYLGSLLALGIERRVIGDIVVTDDSHAVLFVCRPMVSFLLTSLERIGADKVKTKEEPPQTAEALPDTRRFETVSDTAASTRLDAVVSVCTKLSRDKAKQLVTSGMTDLNFRTETAPDTEVPEGAYLSVRGYGRFLFDGVTGTSKKGRLHLTLRRFI